MKEKPQSHIISNNNLLINPVLKVIKVTSNLSVKKEITFICFSKGNYK
jgi:hypothetical protein